MKDFQAKHIGSFEDFCSQSKKKQIKESSEVVAIDVPFYNEAIDRVLTVIRTTLGMGDTISWPSLVDYIKVKNLITDRQPEPDNDSMVLAYIRDLLFQYYGDTVIGGDIGCLTCDSAAVGAKTLIFSQLSSEILHRIREEAGLEIKPEAEDQKPVAKVSLDTYYDDIYDDNTCYEHKHIAKQRPRNIAGYEGFTKTINESVAKISVQHDKSALNYVLDKVETAAGSLNLEDIIEVIKGEDTTISKYVDALAYDYVKKNVDIELDGDKLKDDDDHKRILRQARKLFANKITSEALGIITKENRSKLK